MRKFYLYLANFLDIVHIPAVLLVMVFGDVWMPQSLWIATCSAVIALQIICLGCPLIVVTCWLRRKHNPNYKLTGSFTFWLYRRYGRWVGIPVFIALVAVGTFVAGYANFG